MIEALGVELWDGRRQPVRRHRVSDFPMLGSQKRSAFGFHQIGADGVERCPAPSGRVSVLEGAVRPSAEVATAAEEKALRAPYGGRPDRLLQVLQRLADQGDVLPSHGELGAMLDLPGHRGSFSGIVSSAIKCLVVRGDLQLWVGDVRHNGTMQPRAIRLHDGRVLRNGRVQADIDWDAVA